jgi:hypothetical protein
LRGIPEVYGQASPGGRHAVGVKREELLIYCDLGGRDKSVAMAELKLAADFHRTLPISEEQIRLARNQPHWARKLKSSKPVEYPQCGINKPTEVLVCFTRKM